MTQYYVNPGDFTDIKKYRGSERNVTLPDGTKITNFLAVPDGSFNVWPQGITTPIVVTPYHDKVEELLFTGSQVNISFDLNHWNINRVFNSVLSDLRKEIVSRIYAGITHNANDYATDRHALMTYDDLKGTNTAVTLILLDGETTISLSKIQFQAFVEDLAVFITGFIDNAKVHFDAIVALNDAVDQNGLENYDVTTGWPTNPAPAPEPTGPTFSSILP